MQKLFPNPRLGKEMQIKKIGKMLKSEAKTENEGSTQQVSSMCVK